MDSFLKCPVCGSDSVHIQGVEVNRGGELTLVDVHGTHLQAGDPQGRGAKIEIVFWCEENHSWEHLIWFHKGATLIENNILPGCEICISGHASDLWRD